LLVCVNDSGVSDEAVSSKGYVTFSLTNGPEYHVSQVTDAFISSALRFKDL